MQQAVQITYEQLESDSNHYIWRAGHGEIFEILKEGQVVATLSPPVENKISLGSDAI